ncbi:MAG TPA: tyrosine-type recombinase/integrase [Kangiella sp.]
MYHDINFTLKAFNTAQRINNEDTEYRVKGKEHLRLSVNKNTKSLRVRTSINGNRINKKIGNYPQLGLKAFEKIANELMERYRSGGNLILANKVTLDRFFERIYFPDAKKRKASWKNDESRYRLYIKPVLGSLTLPEIRPYHIQKLLNKLPEHLSDRSYDLIRALLSVMLNKAVKLELLEKNPCRSIPARNNCRVVRRYLTDAELPVFIEACFVEVDPHSEIFSHPVLALLLSLFTGIRIGNCCSITLDMISEDSKTLYLPKTKSGKGQTIYLSKTAQWIIRQALTLNPSKYIFPSPLSNDAPITYPKSAFIRVCARAGIACAGSNHPLKEGFPTENLTIHCLRKTFATIVLNHFSTELGESNTSSIEVVRQLLGHANQRVTRDHYAFSNDVSLMKGVEIAANVMTNNIRKLPLIANID